MLAKSQAFSSFNWLFEAGFAVHREKVLK